MATSWVNITDCQILVHCYDKESMPNSVLEKATKFLTHLGIRAGKKFQSDYFTVKALQNLVGIVFLQYNISKMYDGRSQTVIYCTKTK